MAALPPGFKLPDLRIDIDGDWYDEGIQVTHPGILANLRGNLQKDVEGYFIQTRVRIPVKVDDAPFVLTRIERRGEALHAVLNDGAEERVDPATVRLGRGDVPYCVVIRQVSYEREVAFGQGCAFRTAVQPDIRGQPILSTCEVDVGAGLRHSDGSARP